MPTIRTQLEVIDNMSNRFAQMEGAARRTAAAVGLLESSYSTELGEQALNVQAAKLRVVAALFIQQERQLQSLNNLEMKDTHKEESVQSQNEVTAAILDSKKAQEQYGSALKGSIEDAGQLFSFLKKIAGTVLNPDTIKGGMEASDEYMANSLKLGRINDGLQTQEQLQQKVYEAAQRSKMGYTDMLTFVEKLGSLSGKTFQSNDEAIQFTEQMNMAFRVNGGSAQDSAASTDQVTQGMASGKLSQDGFDLIAKDAPLLAKAMADAAGTGIDGLKAMASEGGISADMIKNALFQAGDEIEQRFGQLPMTFEDSFTEISNVASMAFGEVMQKANDMLNSDLGQTVIQVIYSGIEMLAAGVSGLLGIISSVGNYLMENWSSIGPLITFVAVCVGVLAGAFLVYKLVSGMAAMAQMLFNTTLLGCPIVWIIGVIIGLITFLYMVVGAINEAQGTTVSATGIICGVLSSAGAFIWNLFLGLLQLVFGVVEQFYGIFQGFANFFGNIFNDPIGAIIGAFGKMADSVLGVLEQIASAIDMVFGSNMADTVSGWRGSLDQLTTNAIEKYGNGTYKEVVKDLDINQWLSEKGISLDRITYTDAWSAGYDLGENADQKVKNFDPEKMLEGLKPPLAKNPKIPAEYNPNPLGYNPNPDGYRLDPADSSALEDIGKDTSDIKKSVDITGEDLKYLRDIAETDYINKFTTAEIKIDLGGVNNTINSELDIDEVSSIVSSKICGTIEQEMYCLAEGVH